MGHRTDSEISALAPVQTVNGATGAVSVTPASIGAATPASVSSQIAAETAAAVPAATESTAGKAEIIDAAEVAAATDDSRILTIAKAVTAFLRRTAGDFATFTTKATPVAADVILLEDSADLNNKKKATFGTLFAAIAGTNRRSQVIPVFGAAGSGNPFLGLSGAAASTLTDATIFGVAGSTLEGTPTAIYAILQKVDANGDARVELIVDTVATTPLTVASLSGINPPLDSASPNWSLFSLGTITNWPSATGVLRVRFRRSAGGIVDEVRLSSLLIVY